MAFPTLPQSWSAPTSCFDTTDIYAVITTRDPEDTDVVGWEYWYGVPTNIVTGDCLPPSYITSAPYFGQTCPPGYRNARAFTTNIYNQGASATICCPGGTEGCEFVIGDQTFIATFTDNTRHEQRMTTFSGQSGSTLHAFGVTIVSTTPTSLDTSISSFSSTTSISTGSLAIQTSSPTSSAKPSGLSTGAAVGIGIGATLGAISLLLLGWLMYRRRAKKRSDNSTIIRDSERPAEPLGFTYCPSNAFPSPVAVMSEISNTKSHEPLHSQPQGHEFPLPDGQRPFRELPS
ncbi:hypothetical protein FHL15_011207 [Xylaria flabelliformis]|uniref:Mid2 domain-containing protein n=1 Tax=Xylaria flabelliformis TaxID=2512241 RepID=A0A553HIW3_9PEZI|nr:hypothetical protein FHL15_011207 [Xylaria flabelliformis]